MMWKYLLFAAACLHCACASTTESVCTSVNATDGCGVNCGKHCTNLFNPPKNGTVPRCNALCRAGGCDCKDGYWEDDQQNGKCVLAQDCVPPECPTNEEFQLCLESCPPRTCATKDIQYKCIAPPVYPDPQCKPPGCRCIAGTYRNTAGSCVTYQECDSDD